MDPTNLASVYPPYYIFTSSSRLINPTLQKLDEILKPLYRSKSTLLPFVPIHFAKKKREGKGRSDREMTGLTRLFAFCPFGDIMLCPLSKENSRNISPQFTNHFS